MTNRRFDGWRIVGAGAAMQAMQAGLFLSSYGNYAVVLNQQFGWSKTMLSVGYSATRFESALLGPFQGWALDRFGTRRIMRIGVVLMSLGFFAFSQIQNLWHFILTLVLLAVGTSLSGFLSVTTALVRWFERKRARALAIGSMGFAIGGASAPGVVFLLERIGWRWTLFLAGVVVALLGWPVAGMMDGQPSDRDQFVDGIDPATIEPSATRAEGVSDVHLTANEAIRTRAFWMISLGHASALLVVGSVMAHLSLYLTEEQGFTLQQASLVGGAVPLLQLVGMVLGGQLGDRVNKRLLACLAMGGHLAGLVLLTYASARWMIWAFVPLHGIAWGVRGPLMQALRADYFGSSHFGKIMGFSSVIVMAGTAGGPLLVGTLADSTGTYQLGFTIVTFAAAFGILFFILATPPKPGDRALAGAGSAREWDRKRTHVR